MKITSSACVAIIGMGYVGLPLAVSCSKHFTHVIGIESNLKRISILKKGKSYIADVKGKDVNDAVKNKNFQITSDYRKIKKADIIIMCIPTPLTRARKPDLSAIIHVSEKIRENLTPSKLIILESSTYPGTTEEIVKKILEKSKLKCSKDFFLAFSPERIDPGNKCFNVKNTPKIVGGVDKISTCLVYSFYKKFIGKVVKVSSASAAEMVKLLENSFRFINISFINEFTLLCNRMGLNIHEIINAAKTKPYGFMPFYPSSGIGGHCIPIDPIYLAWKAKEFKFNTRFISLADKMNKKMPHYVANKLEFILKKNKKIIPPYKIFILGVTYKKNIADIRESSALKIIPLLIKKKIKVFFTDPYIKEIKINSRKINSTSLDYKKLKNYDLILLLTDHNIYNFHHISKNSNIVLDTKNVIHGKNVHYL